MKRRNENLRVGERRLKQEHVDLIAMMQNGPMRAKQEWTELFESPMGPHSVEVPVLENVCGVTSAAGIAHELEKKQRDMRSKCISDTGSPPPPMGGSASAG